MATPPPMTKRWEGKAPLMGREAGGWGTERGMRWKWVLRAEGGGEGAVLSVGMVSLVAVREVEGGLLLEPRLGCGVLGCGGSGGTWFGVSCGAWSGSSCGCGRDEWRESSLFIAREDGICGCGHCYHVTFVSVVWSCCRKCREYSLLVDLIHRR